MLIHTLLLRSVCDVGPYTGLYSSILSDFASDSVSISCQACVASISIRLPILPVSGFIMAPTAPLVGDIMSFRYPDERYHRFYDGCPGSRRAKPFQAYVDLHGTILVQDVQTATRDGVEFVAVQFRSHNGTLLWTTFSKGDAEALDFFLVWPG